MSSVDGPESTARTWLDKLEIFIADGVDERDAQAYGMSQIESYPPAQEGVRFLPMTAAEISDIALLTDAASRFRRYFGLGPVAISTDRIHLVSVIDMRTWFGRMDACTNGGHAYLAEYVRYGPYRWIASVSHEIAHLASYLSARVEIRPTADGDYSAKLRYDRHGVKLTSSDGELVFIGLNEAVTELVALNIRDVSGTISPPFRERHLDDGARITGYGGQVTLLAELFRQMAESGSVSWTDVPAVEAILLHDYLAGTDEFLDALAEAAPETHDFLRKLGDSPEDGEIALARSKTKLV